VQHLGIAMQPGDAGAVGGVDREIERRARGSQSVLDRGEQFVDPLPGYSGSQEARVLVRPPGGDVAQILALFGGEAVDLVPDFDDALATIGAWIDAELAQYSFNITLLRFGVFV